MAEPVRLPVPARTSQATHIEQSRAAAEVFAAMQAARAFPRDETAAVERMREACARQSFADRAFYAVPRGGKTSTGPSVHLMRELARIWGNVHYGVHELDRDPVGPGQGRGRSEMIAFAWDLEANVRDSMTWIVEHARDRSAYIDRSDPDNSRPASVDALTTLQAVYENNANMGARRVRGTIRAVLPVWLVDEAVALCNATNVKGNGKPLDVRIADTLAWFDGQLGVRRERIEARIGKPSGRWTAQDLADLGVIGNSIRRNETTVDEAFPSRPVTPDELPAGGTGTPGSSPANAAGGAVPVDSSRGGAAPTAPAPASTAPAASSDSTTGPQDGPAQEPTPPAAEATPPASDEVPKQEAAQVGPRSIADLFDGLGVPSRSDRLALVSLYVQRPVPSLTHLSGAERHTVTAALETIIGQDDEGRAADLARDLAEARQLAGQRDQQ